MARLLIEAGFLLLWVLFIFDVRHPAQIVRP
jgi:hypothetical protein